MAYEVVKTIRGRQYRYRVQSERDPQTGKSRNRWTYIGRVGREGDVARSSAARPNARVRLLDAAARLLERGEASAVTADAIASAAGVAHGTFYRYFRDRSDALEALARHLRQTRSFGDDTMLDDAVGSRSRARETVRWWITERLRKTNEHPASIRAWYALIAGDARLAAYRKERRTSTLRRLREHLDALNASGYAQVVDPAATAQAVMALYEGTVRAAIIDGDGLDEPVIAAVADVVERAIFGRLS